MANEDVFKLKVLNYICGVRENAADIVTNIQTEPEIKKWLQTDACGLVVLLTDRGGTVTGVQINLRKEICDQYLNGSCHFPTGSCLKWHICKRFLEGDCSGECGRSHDFHDKRNRATTETLALQDFRNEAIGRIVRYSLPQVCINYLENKCRRDKCPYLHVCSSVFRGTSCKCALSHDIAARDKTILERYANFNNEVAMINYSRYNTLVPVEQVFFKSNRDEFFTGTKNQISPRNWHDFSGTVEIPIVYNSSRCKKKEKNTKSSSSLESSLNLQGTEGAHTSEVGLETDDAPVHVTTLRKLQSIEGGQKKEKIPPSKILSRSTSNSIPEIGVGGEPIHSNPLPTERGKPENVKRNPSKILDPLFIQTGRPKTAVGRQKNNMHGSQNICIAKERPKTADGLQKKGNKLGRSLSFQFHHSRGTLELSSNLTLKDSQSICIASGRPKTADHRHQRKENMFQRSLSFHNSRSAFKSHSGTDNEPINSSPFTFERKVKIDEDKYQKRKLAPTFCCSNLNAQDSRKMLFPNGSTSSLTSRDSQNRFELSSLRKDATIVSNPLFIRTGRLKTAGGHQKNEHVPPSRPKSNSTLQDSQSICIASGRPKTADNRHQRKENKFQRSLSFHDSRNVFKSHSGTDNAPIHSSPFTFERKVKTDEDRYQKRKLAPAFCCSNLNAQDSRKMLLPNGSTSSLTSRDSQNEHVPPSRPKSNLTLQDSQSICIASGRPKTADRYQKKENKFQRSLSFQDSQSVFESPSGTDIAPVHSHYYTQKRVMTSKEKKLPSVLNPQDSQSIPELPGLTEDSRILFSSFSHGNSSLESLQTDRKETSPPSKPVNKELKRQQRSHAEEPTSHFAEKRMKDDKIPNHWSVMAPNQKYVRVKLDVNSDELKEVEKIFRKTMKDEKVIVSIERVQNPFLWEKYCRKKENMVLESAQNTANEKQLFHGTSSDSVDAICKQNFDWRVCGKNGKKYGEGSYFAVKASYSHHYARKDADGSHFMFLAKVLVGLFTEGKPNYRRPPPKDPSTPASDLYDSCVDNKFNPTIFVVFEMDQYYPEYVVKYFTLERCPTPSVQSANPRPTSRPQSSDTVKPFPVSKVHRPAKVSGNAQLSLANKEQSSGRLTYNTAKAPSISNVQQPTPTSLIPHVGVANQGLSSGRLSPNAVKLSSNSVNDEWPLTSIENSDRKLFLPTVNPQSTGQATNPDRATASQSSTEASGSNVRRTTKRKKSKCCGCLIL